MNDSATSRFSVLGNHAASIVIQIKPKAAFFSLGPKEKCSLRFDPNRNTRDVVS